MTNVFKQDLMEKTISLKLVDKKIDNKGNLVPFSWEEMAYELAKINPVWIKELGADALDENTRKQIIQQNPGAIRFFKNPTDEEKIMAVKQAPDLISYIKKPTEEVMRAALFSDKVGTEDPAKQTSPEIMWRQVTGKLGKLPNGLAAAVSEDPRYARFAYDDFGIHRKENGQIKSGSRYNVFGKALRKYKPIPNTVNQHPELVDYLSQHPDKLKQVEDALRNKIDMSKNGLATFAPMSSFEVQKARKLYNDRVARDVAFDATKEPTPTQSNQTMSPIHQNANVQSQNVSWSGIEPSTQSYKYSPVAYDTQYTNAYQHQPQATTTAPTAEKPKAGKKTTTKKTATKKESALSIFQNVLSESTKRFLERE